MFLFDKEDRYILRWCAYGALLIILAIVIYSVLTGGRAQAQPNWCFSSLGTLVNCWELGYTGPTEPDLIPESSGINWYACEQRYYQ